MNRILFLGIVILSGIAASPPNAAAQPTYPEFRLTPPPPADRQVDPFGGSLGRPCVYRWRATPSGTRKVRVCY